MTLDRPIIPSAHFGKNTSQEEAFQNATIRPIIKQQHGQLIDATNIVAARKIKGFARLHNRDKIVRLTELLSKDRALRKNFLELITESFTEEEHNLYISIKKESNRRIHQIICERILNSINQFE